MAFHKDQMGSFGSDLPSDRNGFVPEEGDEPSDFQWDHDEFTMDFDDDGNGYEGYAQETWDGFVAQAIAKTREASAALEEWRSA